VPVLEALISINNKLGQKEAAAGLLEWGQKNLQGDLKVRERWYEKLHEWDRALDAYKKKELVAGGGKIDTEVLLGELTLVPQYQMEYFNLDSVGTVLPYRYPTE
jgi:FKBP12-rapamycin complex-associated protein